jgi:hypothetical protein
MLGVLITVEAAAGMTFNFWAIDPHLNSYYPTVWFQIVITMVLLLVGIGTIVGRAKAPGQESSRYIRQGSFLGMALLAIGANVILGRLGDLRYLLRPFGSLLVGIGAAGLWGCALASREDPSNPRLKSLGKSYAAVAGAGIVASTIPEIWDIVESLVLRSGSYEGPSLNRLLEIPGRLCILWCAIQPFRRFSDDAAIRYSSTLSHRVLVVWLVLSLLGTGWMLLSHFFMRRVISPEVWTELALGWRTITYYTLFATAVTAVRLSQETPDRSTTSTHPILPNL